MATKNKSSLIYWIIGGVVLAGGVVAFFLLRPKKEDEEKPPYIPSPSPSGGSPKTTSSYANTPFFNKEQGDTFRQWINKYYSSYAKKIDLDSSGDYNNTYIKRAWFDYGERYKAQNPNYLKTASKKDDKGFESLLHAQHTW